MHKDKTLTSKYNHLWHECYIYQNTIFLGVIIDNKFGWSNHINYIKNKIAKPIGIINKTRNFLNKNTLRNLYYTFIYPYLIYCIEIWGNTNDIYLDPLIEIHKKRYKSCHVLTSS